MNTTTQANELFSQMTGRAVEAFSVFAEANQKIMRDLVDLSASTAKEGVRVYAELSSSAVEALKESQSYLLRRQGELQEAPRDPLSVYQKGVLDSVESAQKAFKILESNAQAMTRSAERLQVTAEQTGKDIQATFAQVASKVKSLSLPSPDRPRRRSHGKGRARAPGPSYFSRFFSSRSSRVRSCSRSAATSLRRASASPAGSPFFSGLASEGAAGIHPARAASSRKTRSASRWLERIPSRLDFMDFCTKSCQASPCLMSWCRNAVGKPARRLRSFSRMIWARVTEVRSSPVETSTTEISLPARISSSSSSRVT